MTIGCRSFHPDRLVMLTLIVALAGMPGGSRTMAQAATGSSATADTARIISPGKALLRSALIPGWGQAYVGHYAKAGILLAGGATTLGLALNADGRVNDLADRRPLVSDPAERDLLEGDIEHWRGERRRWILWAAAVWVYAMLDAYVDAHLHNIDAVEPAFTPPPTPRMDIAPVQLYLGLSISLGGRKR